jgi:siroheme synthase
VHDRLVSRAVLDGIPSHAALIDVGKAPECHPVPENEINAMLVDLARSGRRVVRLNSPLINSGIVSGIPHIEHFCRELALYLVPSMLRSDFINGL